MLLPKDKLIELCELYPYSFKVLKYKAFLRRKHFREVKVRVESEIAESFKNRGRLLINAKTIKSGSQAITQANTNSSNFGPNPEDGERTNEPDPKILERIDHYEEQPLNKVKSPEVAGEDNLEDIAAKNELLDFARKINVSFLHINITQSKKKKILIVFLW